MTDQLREAARAMLDAYDKRRGGELAGALYPQVESLRAALSRAPGEATEAATCADCGGMGVVEGVPPGAYPLGPRPEDFREYTCPACSAAPADPTEAMVEAGVRAFWNANERATTKEVIRDIYAAMRAESEGGGVVAGTGDRMEREACAGDSASAGPGPIGAAPPSPGSDLLREVEAFLRAIGESPALLDTKDAATARELAGELRDLIEGGPNA